MSDMENEIKEIERASRGEDVRDSIISAFRKLEKRTSKSGILMSIDFDSATDKIQCSTDDETLSSVSFEYILGMITGHIQFLVLYHETDTELKNEIFRYLYLADYSFEHITFASNVYDGVRIQIVIKKDDSVVRTAEQIEMEVIT